MERKSARYFAPACFSIHVINFFWQHTRKKAMRKSAVDITILWYYKFAIKIFSKTLVAPAPRRGRCCCYRSFISGTKPRIIFLHARL